MLVINLEGGAVVADVEFTSEIRMRDGGMEILQACVASRTVSDSVRLDVDLFSEPFTQASTPGDTYVHLHVTGPGPTKGGKRLGNNPFLDEVLRARAVEPFQLLQSGTTSILTGYGSNYSLAVSQVAVDRR